ncbi:dihydroorotate dehydrogenase electron transfer subunit [Quadrisphaera granulorum]|uniref:Dihydroorotate dehydrogenase electron transfer subunit n=1 Tax=Quadrisphaera granulorum TaxID=317664 RepID=A0A315ZR12_9ACTN|nr:dihydroorotate dehydrogenase electron transfer subunit [Quadrisphaera granulorum]PWJ48015.1 dihydroorotate dehydrogenase electron transfer subunit [Quadrisphaera granulorum]SZE98587.1 dihydroorotate dehydrogenase electron transfer subunit [Quadrisphaera granulorum]
MSRTTTAPAGVQEAAEVVSARPVGAYTHLVLHAPEAARRAQPGQFVACGVGDSGMLLRRSLSLHAADPVAGTLEVVVAAAGPGTRLLAAKRPGDVVPTTAPLGRPFPIPEAGTPGVVIGGGYGAAPLPWLARVLTAQGSRVVGIVGAASADRLLGTSAVDDATALDGIADALVVTTDDGSLGAPGRVTDALPEVLLELADLGDPWVYACGPMPMLRSVHTTTREVLGQGARTWLAVEESMACGVGVCMTCVLPVAQDDDDGVRRTRMLRACTAGPVFDGDALRWDAIGAAPHLRGGALVPDDAVGAPTAMGGH